MKRISLVIATAVTALTLGAATAHAQPVAPFVPPISITESTEDAVPAQGDGEGVVRTASPVERATAYITAAGDVVVRQLRTCGVGALVGATTSEVSVQNVDVLVNAVGQRLAAVAGGPAAVITVAAYGCLERVLNGIRQNGLFETEAQTAPEASRSERSNSGSSYTGS
ncbi:MAG: hypothetical protein GX542_02815 [Rhodococcus sp.]|nr:hypothetical protein [Rhodococcus sp. (in: high G+C Gram-positive bacteria)]